MNCYLFPFDGDDVLPLVAPPLMPPVTMDGMELPLLPTGDNMSVMFTPLNPSLEDWLCTPLGFGLLERLLWEKGPA